MGKILVTGAAGFLGSHLCDRLIQHGGEVVGLDNLYTGSLSNIEHLMGTENFQFIEQDIVNPIELDGIDKIYNMACPASPPLYQKDPIFTLDTCYIGTKNILELAAKNNARILQASTSEVYGDPLEHPQTEAYKGNVNTFGIRSCYDEGKRITETLCLEYMRGASVSIKVIRIFNTYGPRMDINDGRVVSNLIIQALKNEPLTIYGDGLQTRSFCYADDMIDGITAMMESDPSFTGPVNLGNTDEFTILELAQKLISITGSSSKIVHKELPKDDPLKRRPDISLAKKMLGWEPRVKLEGGIKKTVEYFKNVLSESSVEV